MNIIDAHAHFPADHPDALELVTQLEIKVLNISLGLDVDGSWRTQPASGVEIYGALARNHAEQFAWCTSFDPPGERDLRALDDYFDRVKADLQRDFERGAVACKVWKNFGMEVRDLEGDFLHVDAPALRPIFDFIDKQQWPVILHTGEPCACWEPLNPASPHYEYYSEHPQWHMHGRTDVPSHAELIDARDRLVAQHPKIRFIGAHLGSLEHDVAELSARLKRFDNFVVDTAERLLDLAAQPASKVRSFIEQHADRVLFGSDLLFEQSFSQMTDTVRSEALERCRRAWSGEQAFYRDTGPVRFGGRTVEGLGLPQTILDQVFRTNAERCYFQG